MRIYITHPYTGNEEMNRESALEAEKVLRQATPNVEFFNPVGRMSQTKHFMAMSYANVMAYCLEALADSDGVVFCGDWAHSSGCRLEAHVAKQSQLPRWYGADAYVKNWAQVEEEARRKEAAV